MRVPTALMIRLLVSLPNRKFPSRILNGLRVGNPQANFSRSPKPSQEIVFPYSNICFTQFMWVSPWASMVASSFNLAKGIAIPISAGTSPWAACSGMLSLRRPIRPPLYICCRNHAQQINICGASACRRRRAKESLSNLSGSCRYQKSVYGFGRLLRYSSFVGPAMASAAQLNKTTAAKMDISFFITNAPCEVVHFANQRKSAIPYKYE